jgi:hypothetical protein
MVLVFVEQLGWWHFHALFASFIPRLTGSLDNVTQTWETAIGGNVSNSFMVYFLLLLLSFICFFVCVKIFLLFSFLAIQSF